LKGDQLVERGMHAARVALRVPEASLHPMHRLVCETPTLRREVVLERDATGETTTLLLFVEGDRDTYEATLDAVPTVEEWTTDDADGGFYVYVRARLRDQERGYLDALERDGLLVVPPVELREDRTIRLSLVGDADALSSAVEGFPDELSVDVLHTGAYRRGDGATLSERQREAVRAAWEVGYYELPRSGDLEDVAARLDCGTSAASDLLRRAERRLAAESLDRRR
jgi:hypothetical protein